LLFLSFFLFLLSFFYFFLLLTINFLLSLSISLQQLEELEALQASVMKQIAERTALEKELERYFYLLALFLGSFSSLNLNSFVSFRLEEENARLRSDVSAASKTYRTFFYSLFYSPSLLPPFSLPPKTCLLFCCSGDVKDPVADRLRVALEQAEFFSEAHIVLRSSIYQQLASQKNLTLELAKLGRQEVCSLTSLSSFSSLVLMRFLCGLVRPSIFQRAEIDWIVKTDAKNETPVSSRSVVPSFVSLGVLCCFSSFFGSRHSANFLAVGANLAKMAQEWRGAFKGLSVSSSLLLLRSSFHLVCLSFFLSVCRSVCRSVQTMLRPRRSSTTWPMC
jgi:hypothetical protein